jgi:hypothetical protein
MRDGERCLLLFAVCCYRCCCLLGKREYEGRETEMDLLLEAVVDCIAVDCCYCVMLKGKERCQGDERFTGFQDPAMVALIP